MNDTCSSLANLNACPSSIPFCCPTSTTCIPLTSSDSAVICCPTGSDCAYIQPVTCEITLQNSTAYPYNTLHTSELDASLPTCGTQCCPLGYSCLNGICARQSIASTNTTSTSTATTSTATGIVVPTNSAISIIVANATTVLSGSDSTHLYTPRAILIGIAAGLIFGVLATLVCFYLLRRRQRMQKLQHRKSTSIFGGKTPAGVSEPLFTPQKSAANRSEYLLPLDSAFNSPAPLLGVRSRIDVTPSPPPGPPGERYRGDTLISPITPLSQLMIRRGSIEPPRFPSPLRFGLPVSPMPPPRRPERPTEMVTPPPRSLNGLTALRPATNPPTRSPSRSCPTNPPLGKMLPINPFSPQPAPPAPKPTPPMPPPPRKGANNLSPLIESGQSDRVAVTRQNSDDSYISTGSNGSHKTTASSGTINVLMPPPEMVERDRVSKRGVSTYTTVTMMLDGMSASYGDVGRSGPSRPEFV